MVVVETLRHSSGNTHLPASWVPLTTGLWRSKDLRSHSIIWSSSGILHSLLVTVKLSFKLPNIYLPSCVFLWLKSMTIMRLLAYLLWTRWTSAEYYALRTALYRMPGLSTASLDDIRRVILAFVMLPMATICCRLSPGLHKRAFGKA